MSIILNSATYNQSLTSYGAIYYATFGYNIDAENTEVFSGWQKVLTSGSSSSDSGFPPMPVTTSGVVGQWVDLNAVDGVLPSGGMWAYAAFVTDAGGGVMAANSAAGIATGGTTTVAGNAAYRHGFAWRIS